MSLPVLILSGALVLIAYCTLTVLQISGVADDPGLGWHLLTGESIIRTGAIPRTDPFLATAAPREWIADQWLSDLLLTSVLQAGGPERGMALLYALITGVFLAIFMGITYLFTLRSSSSPLASAIASLIALKLSTIHFIIRPVVFGFVLFSIASAIIWSAIARVRRGEPLRVRDTFWLIPLAALWANIHPSFGLGILLLAAATLGLVIDTVVLQQRPLALKTFLLLIATVALMVVATLLNPYGAKLWHQVVGLVGSDFFMNLNKEWQPLAIRSPIGVLFLQTIALILIGSFLALWRGSPIYITEFLIVGFFGWSALSSARFLPYFAIASAPILALSLVRIAAFEPFMRLPPYRRCADSISTLDRAGRRTTPWYLLAVAAFATFPVFDAYLHGTVYPYRGPFEQSRKKFPYDSVGALHEIITHEGLETPLAVAATPDWGGFLAYHGKDRLKPVIDDRNSLLGVSPYKDFLDNQKVGGDVVGYLKRTGARFLLLEANEPLAIYLRDTRKLREKWRGEISALFELSE